MKATGRDKRRQAGLLALAVVLSAPRVLAQGGEAPAPAAPAEARQAEAQEEGEGLPRVRFRLGPVAVWRQYCARPGVEGCAEYDARPVEERQGDTVDYRTRTVPYVGVAGEVEVFPLARWESAWRGLGLTLDWRQAWASATVRVSSPSGPAVEQQVSVADTAFGALAAYRWYFGKERPTSLWGYVGGRVGVQGRAFATGQPAERLPSVTHRLYPVLGVDLSVPLMRPVRVEGSGQVFLQPQPGTWWGDEGGTLQAERADFGASTSSLGWAGELGVAGELWGPWGYQVRFRLEGFRDRFSGPGTLRGWSAGGVAEEFRSSVQACVGARW